MNYKNILFSFILSFICFYYPFEIYGDGGFYKTSDKKLLMPAQRAVIFKNNEEEKLLLQSEFYGSEDDFIWIIPFPSNPTIKIFKDEVFNELEKYTEYEEENKDEDEDRVKKNVKKVIIIDTKIFSGEETKLDTLFFWAKKNSFNINSVKEEINNYFNKKYFIAVVRMSALNDENNKVPVHWKTPIIKFTFKSETPFFPLKFHSDNIKETKLTLYAFNEKPINEKTIFQKGFEYNPKLLRGKYGDLPLVFNNFPELLNENIYLNKLEDIITTNSKFNDLIVTFEKLAISKYKYSLENPELPTTQRIKAIQALRNIKDAKLLEMLRKLLVEDNSSIVVHAAISLLTIEYDPEIERIFIEKFKNDCIPYINDCYPVESNKSYIELFKDLNLKGSVPILVEILNNAGKNLKVPSKGKNLSKKVVNILEAMERLGVTSDAMPGIKYVLEYDRFVNYKSIVIAAKLLGEIGDEKQLSLLNDLAEDDWGGRTEKEAMPYFGLRDAAMEAILKIKLKNILSMEQKILYLRKLLNKGNKVERYHAAIFLLKLGDKEKTEEIFLQYLNDDDFFYGASKVAVELKITTSISYLVESIYRRKGNVPDAIYDALEVLDYKCISSGALIKVLETNPNPFSVQKAKKILIKNGGIDSLKEIESSDLIESGIKDEIINKLKIKLRIYK